MGIDSSIYQNQKQFQAPDMLDSFTRAANLRQLGMQNQKAQQGYQDEQAVRQAFSNNVGQDGSVNRQGVLSDLAKSAPMQAVQYKGQFSQQDAAQADQHQKVLADKINQAGVAAQFAMSAKDQPSYDGMLGRMKDMGLDTSHMPAQFDPGYMRQLAVTSLDQKQRLEGMKTPGEIDKNQAETAKNWAETAKIQGETVKRNPILGQSDDPAKLVPGYVPKEHQDAAFKEIDAAENTKKMSSAIMDAFDQSVKDTSGSGALTSFVKTPRSSQALHQAMQPTFKDLEGTVRQAAMDNTFKNVTPVGTDTAADIATKRAALANYLQSKASAPTARAYGIDLSKFGSTSAYQSPQKAQGQPGTAYAADRPASAQQGVVAPKHGTEDSGYVFMGGDPANQANWKKAR